MFTCLKKPLQSSSRKTIRPHLGRKIVKNRPLTKPIRLQDLVNSARSQTWLYLNIIANEAHVTHNHANFELLTSQYKYSVAHKICLSFQN